MKEFNKLNLTPIFVIITVLLAIFIISEYRREIGLKEAIENYQSGSIERIEE